MTNQKPSKPVGKAQSQDPFRRYLNEEQDPAATKRAYSQVKQILTTGEEILYIAVQKPMMLSLSPDCVVLTNKRFIIYKCIKGEVNNSLTRGIIMFRNRAYRITFCYFVRNTVYWQNF